MHRKRVIAQAGSGILLTFLCLLCMVQMVSAGSSLALQASMEGKSVLLCWNSESETSVYQIEKSQNAEGAFSVIGTVSGQKGTISCYDGDVQLGQTYYYKVSRLEEGQICEESPVIEMTVILAAPTNVMAKNTKNKNVILSWGAVEEATGYEIYRSTNKSRKFKRIGSTEKLTYTDHTVKAGKAYYYKVVAVKKKNKAVSSSRSDAAAVYMKPDAPVLSAGYAKKKMKLTWKKVTGAEKYFVYKKNSKGKFQKLGETEKLNYTDKNVKKGKRYEYQVVAVYEKDGNVVESAASETCKALAAAVDPNKKMVALTFDDGPGRYTKEIVDCLKTNDARATFFVLGCNVDSYKSAMKAADRIGCEIASHTYHHYNLARLSEKEIKKEVSDTDKKIKDAIGKTPVLLRTPGGSVNDTVKKSVGKPIILWSIDTLDWKTRNRDKTVNTVMNNVKDGDIVLMHDIHQPTKEAALILIPRLKSKGYQLVTVSELAQYREHTLKKGKVYFSLRKKK